MNAEIIAIGSELLLGTTVDTNSAYLARQLAATGVNLFRKTVVGDNLERTAAVIREAVQRADLVLCTGGLGPTVDDITREAVAQALDRPLEFRDELMEQIAARFTAMQRPLNENNRRQAYVPQGARAIENPRGTAPAFLVEDKRGTVIVLPGVPHEMRFLFETVILPYLRDERSQRGVILVRHLLVTGLGESDIGLRIADLMEQHNPTVGTSAKQGRCELRMAAHAESTEEAEALLVPLEEELRRRFGESLAGDEPLEQLVTRLLEENDLTLALYEGTLVAPAYRALSATPESLASLSHMLKGIVIQPPAQAVDEGAAAALAQSGAESVRERWQSDLGLGIQAATVTDESGFTPVCVALVSAEGTRQITQRHDLRLPEGWQYAGNLAQDVLRRYLLEASTRS